MHDYVKSVNPSHVRYSYMGPCRQSVGTYPRFFKRLFEYDVLKISVLDPDENVFTVVTVLFRFFKSFLSPDFKVLLLLTTKKNKF